VIGKRYLARVTEAVPFGLFLTLDATALAPDHSYPHLPAWLLYDKTPALEVACRYRTGQTLEVVLFGIDLEQNRLLVALPADTEWLVWNWATVRNLARQIRDNSEFGLLPILADALAEAGCTDEAMLTHCRLPEFAKKGSWVAELLATQE
jgi:hypothetical protein